MVTCEHGWPVTVELAVWGREVRRCRPVGALLAASEGVPIDK